MTGEWEEQTVVGVHTESDPVLLDRIADLQREIAVLRAPRVGVRIGPETSRVVSYAHVRRQPNGWWTLKATDGPDGANFALLTVTFKTTKTTEQGRTT